MADRSQRLPDSREVRMTKSPDFSKNTRETLAKRAAQRCSNPDCFNKTSGPHSDPGRAVNTGEAAHIRGARSTAARYVSSMTDEERSDIANGIWLCTGCATEIEKDEQKFPPKLLHMWKDKHEADVKKLYPDLQVREELQRLQSENIEIRQQLKAIEEWENIKKQYEPVRTDGGAIVWKFYGHPEHYACPNCFEEKRRRPLQDQHTLAGNFQCPGCKTDFLIKPMRTFQKPVNRPKNLPVNPWNGLLDGTNV